MEINSREWGELVGYDIGGSRVIVTHELWDIHRFNSELEKARNRFRSLFLSQYRNSTKAYARKRISFTTAFRWIGNIIEDVVYGTEK